MSDSSNLFSTTVDGVWIVPVFHERLEAADQVRRAVHELDPDAIAVEMPSSLEQVWLRGIDRLPAISVLLYENALGETIYLPIQPADPMVEAAREARQRGLKLACADLDVDGYADYRDAVPDSYTLQRLEPAAVHRVFRDLPRPADPSDARREAAMAYHARRLRDEGATRVLLVCGMHHADGVARALGSTSAIPLTPPERKNVRLVHLHPDSLGETLGEIPFYVAAYEIRRRRLPEEPIEDAPVAAGRTYGPFRVLSGGKGDDPTRVWNAVARAAREAGWTSWNAWKEKEEPGDDWPEADPSVEPGCLDRVRLQWALLNEAERALAASAYDEKVERWQRRNIARYTRNLAALSGRLVVDLFDLLAAARGCVSENFAWELHRLAVAYPPQGETATDLPTARIRADEMYDGVRRIRLMRRIPRRKGRGLESLLRRRRRRDERWPGEWLENFDGDMICSYPPEDIIIEEFGRYLMKRGKTVLSEEAARTVPFTTSILDGIDVRETIRHWTEKRVYVRELGRAPGNVGSVVVVFDEDRDEDGERYPHSMTWLGEHEQESDMAFYCTDPAQGIVGPGICRVTYGAFLLSYPPGRLLDVWSDPDYRMAESKPEVLLLAALDYSRERVVVHVASRPPRSMLYQLASRLGRKILHIPIGTLSPATIRKIRVMHVLSGHDRREIAKDYVW
jgi:hypothetical protein